MVIGRDIADQYPRPQVEGGGSGEQPLMQANHGRLI
jgi:hypothetical protein